MLKLCEHCHEPFDTDQGRKKFCSTRCCTLQQAVRVKTAMDSRPPAERICPRCNTTFAVTHWAKRFCTKKCQTQHGNTTAETRPNDRRFAIGTRGELLAAADLIDRGYEVFFNFDRHGTDLMIRKEPTRLVVEVKTISKPTPKPSPSIRYYDPARCDLVAFVSPAGITYRDAKTRKLVSPR